MADRPILFSGPMIRALLDGSKTQMRRVVKLPHLNPLGQWEPVPWGGPNGGRTAAGELMPAQVLIGHSRTGDILGSPYGQPGDRLWVRETWAPNEGSAGGYLYRADHSGASGFHRADLKTGVWTHSASRWRPSIHMPRAVSRITLEITGVRVERLHAISEADARAEGSVHGPLLPQRFTAAGLHPDELEDCCKRARFAALWQSINGSDSWDANPWVWIVEFRRATQEPTP